MKILDFAMAGSPDPGRGDAIFTRKTHLQNGPESAEFKKMQALATGLCSLFSVQALEEDKQARVFSRSSGTIKFTPIQTKLRNVMALSVPCLAPGDQHPGDVNLGTIEAETHATGFFTDVTTHGH